jgi:hypothetical protein
MRKTINIMALAVGLGLVSGSVLYAESAQAPSDAATIPDDTRARSNMMGGDVAGMMAEMREMTEICNKMMAGPRNQSPPPAEPDYKG